MYSTRRIKLQDNRALSLYTILSLAVLYLTYSIIKPVGGCKAPPTPARPAIVRSGPELLESVALFNRLFRYIPSIAHF